MCTSISKFKSFKCSKNCCPYSDCSPDSPQITEERKANGRFIALCVAVFIIFLMLYHAWIRRTAYANHIQIIVPVSIMLSYTAWVLYSAKRHKRKMILLRNATSLNSVECGRDSFELNSRGEASTTNRGKSSVRCTHVNELASLAKTRRKLPRQQSTLTPECVKEYTHKRRLSLDPAVTKVELDKVLHPSHQKKAKSSKAAKSCKNQGLK